MYADADVYLLDDPLSAVDAKVSEHIFNQCICKLLKDKIVVITTYAEKHMKEADQIVVLHKGSVQGKGSFCELVDTLLDNILAAPYTTSKEKIPRERDDNIDHSCSKPVIGSYDENLEISEEEKATGKISFALYWDFFRAGMHPVAMILLIVLFLATQGES